MPIVSRFFRHFVMIALSVFFLIPLFWLLSTSLKTSNQLFLSDVVAELDAAKQVGMHTYELRRDGAQSSSEHPQAVNFNQINFS